MASTPVDERLRRLAGRQTLTLTHYGRRTGKPFQVTIWFVVDGQKILLATANINRDWVKNVRKTPRVLLRLGGQSFAGEARYLHQPAERDQVLREIRRKYWMFLPLMLLGRALMVTGLMRDTTGAFEVTLSPDNI